jgi:hypothetical protein
MNRKMKSKRKFIIKSFSHQSLLVHDVSSFTFGSKSEEIFSTVNPGAGSIKLPMGKDSPIYIR